MAGKRNTRVSPLAIAAALGIALVLACLYRFERPRRTSPTHRVAPAAAVVVASVQRRDVRVELEGIGTIEACNQVTVKPRVDGQITELDFNEGQTVRSGDVLAKLDDRMSAAKLQQAQAALLKDQASFGDVVFKFDRATRLASEGYVSRSDLDELRSQVAMLKATLAADRAAVKTAQVEMSYTVIRAPISGITGIRLIGPGNRISTSDPGIVVIAKITSVSVVFSLPAVEISGLATGLSDRVLPVDVYSQDDRTKIASGHVAVIDNQIDSKTDTVRLKGVLPNPRQRLRPGDFVVAHLITGVERGALTVPARAIQSSDRGQFVWLLRANSTVEQRPVTTGSSGGPTTEQFMVITHGVAAGDRVVISGQYGLRTGDAVTVYTTSQAPVTAKRDLLDVP